MKICFISDTHTYHQEIKIPEADVLIACGDVTINGEDFEMKSFLTWFGEQKPKKKIFINGNHEVMVFRKSLCDNPSYTKLMVNKHNAENGTDITYLQDSGIEINGLKFWGSPYTPEFFPENWAYQLPRKGAENHWKNIPSDTDILITHGPPFKILDHVSPHAYNNYLPYAGCEALLERVKEVKPLVHSFGHIHGSAGVRQLANPDFTTLFINASTCNESYQPLNKPIVVDINVATKEVTIVDG